MMLILIKFLLNTMIFKYLLIDLTDKINHGTILRSRCWNSEQQWRSDSDESQYDDFEKCYRVNELGDLLDCRR